MKKEKLTLLLAAFAVLPITLFGQDNEKLIKDYISQNKLREYKKSDLTNFIIDNVDHSKSLHGNVVKIQQTYNGLPVYSSVGTALIKDNKIVYYTDNFVKDYNKSTPNNAALKTKNALQKIADDLDNKGIIKFATIGFFEKSDKNKEYAKQRLVYANENNGDLRLAYEYTLKDPKSSKYWNFLIDANDGHIIKKNNLTLSCNFRDDAYSSDSPHEHFESSKNQLAKTENNVEQNFNLFGPDNASYSVFPLPIQAPTFGSRSIITNPWILTASPEGWHSDGTNHYTTTRGNNVYAYENTAGGNAFGFSPDGGVSREFHFPYDTNGTAIANQNASVTNLFYLNNRIHDVFYQLGFTESARNFQQNNFGKGGLGNDYVKARAQDGGGNYNAYFDPTQEGENGVMAMFLWPTNSDNNQYIFYNAPSNAVSRTPNSGKSAFGIGSLPTNSSGVTGNVQLSPVANGCTALPAGTLTGRIGLAERKTCATFAETIKNLQDAGAIGGIIYNNTQFGDQVYPMLGGTAFDDVVTIPSVLITNEEGEYIKSQLAANTTVNVTLKNLGTAVGPDGSFDNGVITHEYGHGISNRLTGDGYSCLIPFSFDTNVNNYSKEQMGEGWSDFFALMLTNKTGDNASVARGMGTYTTGEPTTGAGMRPAKYSPDFSINNYTYGKTIGMGWGSGTDVFPDVHSIGFIWATMLWDLHWKYVEKYGYASDVTANTTNGSTRILQLVTDALKLQACNPTFIDGRDAILAADVATTGAADKCMIWNAFAKRGLGVNASAGNKMSLDDQVEDFTVPAECASLATNEVTLSNNTISIYPNPAKNEFFINFPKNTVGKISIEIYDMSGKLVSSEDKISPNAKKAISTSNLINGTYMVKIKGLGFDAASKVIVNK